MSARAPATSEPSADVDDAVLARRAAAGNAAAFRLIVVRHQAAIVALARNLLGDAAAAEDVAQDAFVAAWRHLDSYDPDRGRLFSWLARITRNRALNELARRRPRPLSEVPERGGDVPVDARLLDADLRRRLDAALANLPTDQRAAFVLAEIHGLPLTEVAAIEGVPVGTVKSRASRARERLRAALAREVHP